jgi:hypothetical protein
VPIIIPRRSCHRAKRAFDTIDDKLLCRGVEEDHRPVWPARDFNTDRGSPFASFASPKLKDNFIRQSRWTARVAGWILCSSKGSGGR